MDRISPWPGDLTQKARASYAIGLLRTAVANEPSSAYQTTGR
jgi:hypothetical protein